MTSTATVDRSEFRHILVSGTIVGAITAASVIVYLLVARLLPPGIVTSLIEAVIVLVGGVCASFLPASFATSRTVQGIAGAAAIGLWGTMWPAAAPGGICRSGGCWERSSRGWAGS